ncbi:MAG: hypothetical protein AB7U66_18415 [Hyphomicrobiaceae bacterium]|uniref:hypothetical protein n=1 Tax=Bradyrhizobium sp. TaxID=376 RepID=UPI003D0BFE93
MTPELRFARLLLSIPTEDLEIVRQDDHVEVILAILTPHADQPLIASALRRLKGAMH